MLKKRNQKGFTLIEIIAVLVILGILAAVAIPKYFAMQDDARASAIGGALAAASSNLNLSYSKYIVNGGTNASVTVLEALADNAGKLNTDLGDFTVEYTGAAGAGQSCTMVISGKTDGGTSWVGSYTGTNPSKTKTVACPW